MATYLFVTDPHIYTPEEIKHHDGWWSCPKATEYGDEILVYLTDGTGIRYLWQAVSVPRRHAHWGTVCDLRFLKEFVPPISLQEMRGIVTEEEWIAPYVDFWWSKAVRVPEAVASKILAQRG